MVMTRRTLNDSERRGNFKAFFHYGSGLKASTKLAIIRKIRRAGTIAVLKSAEFLIVNSIVTLSANNLNVLILRTK